MKTKKVPLRMCIVTRQMLPKKDLIRIVKNSDGGFIIDTTGKLNGRGAYVSNNKEVIEKCKKTKSLNKIFKQQISDDVYNKLMEEFLARNKQD